MTIIVDSAILTQLVAKRNRRDSMMSGSAAPILTLDQWHAFFCHWAEVNKGEETVRRSCICSWSACWRPQDAVGEGGGRQSLKRDFLSRCQRLPSATFPADFPPCRNSHGCLLVADRSLAVKRKSPPSIHMRSRMMPILRAGATLARLAPRSLATPTSEALSFKQVATQVINT
jgi:hypothetical protein